MKVPCDTHGTFITCYEISSLLLIVYSECSFQLPLRISAYNLSHNVVVMSM